MANKKNKFEETFLKLEEESEKVNQDVNTEVAATVAKQEHSSENDDSEKISNSGQVVTNEVMKIENGSVTKIVTIKKTELSEEVIIQQIHEVIEEIKNRANNLEQVIKYENSKRFKVLNKRKTYSDKYRGVTLSIRPEIIEMIEDLRDVLGMDKYEVVETLLLNGLKYSRFED